jgi:hypothetical protein
MAGTRGGVGRIAAMVIALAVVLMLVLADAARAGTYEVAQCGWGVGAELDPTLPRTEGTAAYLHPGYCTAPSPRMEFQTGLANDGEQGVARARWAAPPGTNIVGVRFVWWGALGYAVVQVAGIDDGSQFYALTFEIQHTEPHWVAVPVTGPTRAFEVRLECILLGAAYGCSRSSQSTMSLSDLTLTIDDPVPPQAHLGGALTSGWHGGTVPLEIGAEDAVGSGVYVEEATVDGSPVLVAPAACAVAWIEGAVRGTRLRPCPTTATGTSQVDTTTLADGVHTLEGCAIDLGGGQGCAPPVQIAVDNSPPGVEFAAAPEGQVAASVSDAFSGPAAGTISMRPGDSETWTDLPTAIDHGGARTATLRAQLPDLEAGAYFFRATATDAVGNSGTAQFRAQGSPAEVRRQLAGSGSGPASRGGGASARARGRATHLVAFLGGGHRRGGGARGKRGARTAGSEVTVDYGTAVELRGRLTNAHGKGIAGRPVAVVTRAAGGGGGTPERQRVVTDPDGGFALRLPAGTSRRVLVSFHGGGGFAPARHRSLELRVRAAVSLDASPLRLRTGDSVTLSGQVRPGVARIPARGKLVTIQYLERASGRWRPALVVRTGARGRFKAHYRFRYITGAARIRLRATALPEAGWPYAAGSSPPVTVEVHGG